MPRRNLLWRPQFASRLWTRAENWIDEATGLPALENQPPTSIDQVRFDDASQDCNLTEATGNCLQIVARSWPGNLRLSDGVLIVAGGDSIMDGTSVGQIRAVGGVNQIRLVGSVFVYRPSYLGVAAEDTTLTIYVSNTCALYFALLPQFFYLAPFLIVAADLHIGSNSNGDSSVAEVTFSVPVHRATTVSEGGSVTVHPQGRLLVGNYFNVPIFSTGSVVLFHLCNLQKPLTATGGTVTALPSGAGEVSVSDSTIENAALVIGSEGSFFVARLNVNGDLTLSDDSTVEFMLAGISSSECTNLRILGSLYLGEATIRCFTFGPPVLARVHVYTVIGVGGGISGNFAEDVVERGLQNPAVTAAGIPCQWTVTSLAQAVLLRGEVH